MSSSFKKISADTVQYGSSFVLSGDTDEETVNNLTNQKKFLLSEIENAKKELAELKNSMKDLFIQKDNMISDAEKEAENIKTKAVLKAEEIVSKANAEKDVIVAEATNQGQKQGFEVGYNDGTEKFKQDYKNHINSLNLIVNSTFKVKNEIIFSSETEILELALMIAEKVARVKFNNDKEVFKNMIQTALSLLKEKENVKLVVNPKLVEYASEIAPELSEKLKNMEQIKVVQDKSVTLDGAVVESIDSRIDARISTQMEILARKLLMDNREQNLLTDDIEEKINEKINEVTKE